MHCMRRLSLAAVLALASAAVAQGADYFVNAAAAGPGTGTQQDPFRTVQAAIDAASSGDVIRVAAGTYVENLRIDGKALVLEGGYSAGFVRDLPNNTTTLSGAGGNAVINLIGADATIDGFRITGGTGSTDELPYAYLGGGIYSRDGSPTITNCVIEGNDIRKTDSPSDYYLGGGVHVSNAALATITNNLIRGNFAGRGGGISVICTAALIQGNTVENNVAIGDHGGGMFIGVTNARITQNIIRGNEVGRELGYGWGGGLIFFNSGNSAEISFNVVTGNYASGYGAGEFIDEGAQADIHHELIYGNRSRDACETVSAIAVDGGDGVGSRATIRHCTVVNNVCPDSTRGNGLQVEGRSTVTVTNSIFWNNSGDDFAVTDDSTLGVTFTDSQESYVGTGNISTDPMFENAAADDYRLAVGSPCSDAADPTSPFDDEPVPNGGRADMGRFGGAADAAPSQAPSGGDSMNGGGNAMGASSALCPMVSVLMVTASLIGVRRRCRGQDSQRRTSRHARLPR